MYHTTTNAVVGAHLRDGKLEKLLNSKLNNNIYQIISSFYFFRKCPACAPGFPHPQWAPKTAVYIYKPVTCVKFDFFILQFMGGFYCLYNNKTKTVIAKIFLKSSLENTDKMNMWHFGGIIRDNRILLSVNY